MAGAPKVSVLIPTYNYARYLGCAIQSVLEQDFEDFELIISDDASPDSSAELIRQFAQKDSRIRPQLRAHNIGMVPNWNSALSAARGEYIKFIFGDDCFASRDALRKLVELLDNHPDASMGASGRATIDEHSQPNGVWNELERPGVHRAVDVIAHSFTRSRNQVGEPSAVIFRRALGARGFLPNLRQIVDLEMWIHLLQQGDLAYTPELLCCFRRHGEQQTEKNREARVGDLEMAAILREYLPQLRAKEHGLSRSRALLIASRALFHLQKKKVRASDAPDMEWLRSSIPSLLLPVLRLHYKLVRPLENLERSVRIRRQMREGQPQLEAIQSFLTMVESRAKAEAPPAR